MLRVNRLTVFMLSSVASNFKHDKLTRFARFVAPLEQRYNKNSLHSLEAAASGLCRLCTSNFHPQCEIRVSLSQTQHTHKPKSKQTSWASKQLHRNRYMSVGLATKRTRTAKNYSSSSGSNNDPNMNRIAIACFVWYLCVFEPILITLEVIYDDIASNMREQWILQLGCLDIGPMAVLDSWLPFPRSMSLSSHTHTTSLHHTHPIRQKYIWWQPLGQPTHTTVFQKQYSVHIFKRSFDRSRLFCCCCCFLFLVALITHTYTPCMCSRSSVVYI